MRAVRGVIFVVAGVLTCALLTGCIRTGSYILQRSSGGDVEMTVVGCSQIPVDKFTVVRPDGGDEGSYIWAIERLSGNDVGQEAFTIGLLPSGYVETKPFKPELLTDDARVWFDVEPSPSLGSVRLGDVPADGQPYLIGIGRGPRQLIDIHDFLTSHQDECNKAERIRKLVASLVVILLVMAVGILLAWGRHMRSHSSQQ